MTQLNVVATDKCQINEEVTRVVLDDSVTRMLRSIQDTLGFSAAEDAILKWLEGCSIEGVERLSIMLNDYLSNRREAEMVDNEDG